MPETKYPVRVEEAFADPSSIELEEVEYWLVQLLWTMYYGFLALGFALFYFFPLYSAISALTGLFRLGLSLYAEKYLGYCPVREEVKLGLKATLKEEGEVSAGLVISGLKWRWDMHCFTLIRRFSDEVILSPTTWFANLWESSKLVKRIRSEA